MTAIARIDVSAFVVPTASPESDGTFEWDRTTLVVVHAKAGGITGIGYTYADLSTAVLIDRHLKQIVTGREAMDVAGSWDAMVRSIRNLGRPGISSMAISAVDASLWDLKARLLGISLAALLGRVRAEIPVYGSGGFTSYSVDALQRQLATWVDDGISRVKMKIGRDAIADRERVRVAREAIGSDAELFVDANGAYERKVALQQAEEFTASSVTWFEEPVPSDDLEGLRLIRDRGPAGMAITAGEYGYDLPYFKRMIDAGAVDILQADATRCAGVTGFMRVGALCEAAGLPLSAHTAPSLHAHLCCGIGPAVHVEYFFDHARIEQMLFDGAAVPVGGMLRPDPGRVGLGLELKRREAARFAA